MRMEDNQIVSTWDIKSRIYTLRGRQVMLDKDLAELYGVLTGNLNKAVKRNLQRFPTDFMFQLNKEESDSLVFQFGISNDNSLRFQNGILKKERGKHRKYLPYAFTEQGVATLSGVLKSSKAIEVNIQVMRAFVAMRKFIASNAQVFQRLDTVEKRQIEYQIETDVKFNKIFDAIESKDIKPEKGIFFDGQIFDAYKFVSDLIRTANQSIILIDNYVDDSVLTLFSKREKAVEVMIYTKNFNKQLKLDLEKYNAQYKPIFIKEFNNSHDRFMIIDESDVYHFGASLKDLGKKWFAFSKFDKEAFKLLDKLGLK